MALRASEPLTFMRSMRIDWEIILYVGTSFMMRSLWQTWVPSGRAQAASKAVRITHKVGLSTTTALLALSFTLPLDHFFFLLWGSGGEGQNALGCIGRRK